MSDKDPAMQSLFEEFPPVSTEEWEKIITQDLNGADYKEKLRWKTGEGVDPLPFYRRKDLEQIERRSPIPKKYTGKTPNDWEIREPLFEHDITSANRSARQALERGSRALQLPLSVRRAEGVLGGDLQGLPIQSQQDFTDLFRDISLEDPALHFDAGLASPALLAMLWNEIQQNNLDKEQISGTFIYDPFVYILQNGQYPKDKEQLHTDILQMAEFTTEHLPTVRPLGIDARVYHNAGATIIQELGLAMAAASEYLCTLTDDQFEVGEITNNLHFSFSIGSNYFLEMAKFRAARLLWQNLLEAFGADPEKNDVYLHAETSEWNKTLYDPYTNMLRTSTEGMSAAIAGCDSMTVLPFDQHFRQPTEFSQRIARNQQIILSEEAHLDKVEDPAAGSYYIEKLTDDIGDAAWQVFQEIEREGGLLQAIENGTVQSAIQESQKKRDRAIASRGRIFVGTNQYPNPDDKMAGDIDHKYQTVSMNESGEDFEISSTNLLRDLAKAFADKAKMGDIVPSLLDWGKHHIRTVHPYRGGEAFEEIRLATENHPDTPQVLSLPLGDRNMRKARSTFATNFFGCAGYDIEEPLGFDSVEEAIEALDEQEPDIAVICSSNKEYKKLVPAVCDALSNIDNKPILVLAGYPEDQIEIYKKTGVHEFIYSNCNVLETLKRFQKKLGIIEDG